MHIHVRRFASEAQGAFENKAFVQKNARNDCTERVESVKNNMLGSLHRIEKAKPRMQSGM